MATRPLKDPLMFSPHSSPFGGGLMSSLQCPDFIKKNTQIPRGFSIRNWAAIFYLKFKLSAIVSTIFDSQPPFLPSGVLYVNGVWLKLVALFEIQSQSQESLNSLLFHLKVRPPRSSNCS